MTPYEKSSHYLTLDFQIFWKISAFHCYRQKCRNAYRLINLSTPPSTYPPPDKILLRLWNKNFLAEIYRNIQALAFKVLQEYDALASKNGAVQMLFLTPNRNIFSGKFVKSKKVLAVLREHIVFNVK